MSVPWLSIAIFTPLVGALLTMMVGRREIGRVVALISSVVPLGIGAGVLARTPGVEDFVLQESIEWVSTESLTITYTLGLDGLSGPLFALTALLVVASILFSWEERKRPLSFFALLLVLETSVLGVFAALDLFVFYVFWEFVLIPMFFLIAIWGGENRRYAATKFFVYTFLASLVMLLGFMGMYFGAEVNTFNFLELQNFTAGFGTELQVLLFGALFVGFAVKMPVVPVHTWLPWAHVEAPTAGSVMLAGVLLKMGAYGLIRFAIGAFPVAAQMMVPLMLVLGIASILYAALVCLAQNDLKRMVAFSSISHMGVALLGIATLNEIGFVGAIYMLIAHGLLSPLAFMMCGAIQHGWGTREIDKLGGIMRSTPTMGTFTMAAFIGSLGFPGFAGFIAEIAVLVGTYQAFGWIVVLPLLGVLLTSGYYIWAIQRALHGDLTAENAGHAHDMPFYETAAAGLLTLFAILYGVWPPLLTDHINPFVEGLLSTVGVI
jgi:proton-translocating NADH-quinone oxidoreductase chain M